MTQDISTQNVRRALLTRREIALIDLREEGPFALAHPLFAASLPLSRLELEIFDRVPRRDTLVVLYDDGEGLVETGAARLAALGYSNIRRLQGGLAGWRQAGGEIFQDVNAPSKAFGELVEARRHTPSLPAPEVKKLIETGADIVVLDARRFEEYQTMSIPGGISVPGAELVYRARELAPRPETTIVVNCAGRTRSIIGAQSLVNARIPNKVAALRNGTIGWTLAGQDLDHGQSRRFAPVSPDREAQAIADARAVAYRAGVRHIDALALDEFAAYAARTLYRFDVRTPEEYLAGHLPGFRSAPGGQLVQETDVFAPVRGARIVLADDKGPRADMTASWLAQMGWEVYVLENAFANARLEAGAWTPHRPPFPRAEEIHADFLADQLLAGTVELIDLSASPAYKRGHIPGARFAIRSQLAQAVRTVPNVLDFALTSEDGALARFAAPELAALSGRNVVVLSGGNAGWLASGRALTGNTPRYAVPPEDVYRRPYEGTDNPVSAMQAYLDWEYGLVDQLARDGTHGFYVI